MLHLLCVPSGCTVTDVFYQKALQQKFEETVLVASSEVLVGKTRMQGIRAVTFDALANAVAEQCSAQLRDRLVVRRISRKAQELILQDILDRLLEKGRLPYFGRLAGKKGFVQSVASMMEQIGSCGATAEEIDTAFAHWDGRSPAYRQKDREIAEIYREYLAYLIQNNIYDMAGLYRVAAEELAALRKAGGAVTWKTLYFTGFYRFDALQLTIIRLLSQTCDVWIALPYEPGRPELYGAAEFTYGDLMRYATPERLPAVPVSARAASLRHIVRNLRHNGRSAAEHRPPLQIMADIFIAETVFCQYLSLTFHNDTDIVVFLISLQNPRAPADPLYLSTSSRNELLHLCCRHPLKQRQLMQIKMINLHRLHS